MNSLTCANNNHNSSGIPCSKQGTKACANCMLVLYCSKECQSAHWPLHKAGCTHALAKATWRPTWEKEGRTPDFMVHKAAVETFSPSTPSCGNRAESRFGGNKELYGDLPAVDLLRLKDNEGVDYVGDLTLLLTASGDIRNLVKTIVSLPEDYTGALSVDINDHDEIVTTRNLVLLLIALNFGIDEAPELMLHMWYSAFLPEGLLNRVRDVILPIIQKALAKGKTEIESEARETSFIYTWKHSCSTTTVTATLPSQDWDTMLSFFDMSNEAFPLNHGAALMHSVTLAPSRQDYRDKAAFRLPSPWRIAKWKFRALGILLPFGGSGGRFGVPNPTFFCDKSSWPLPDDADPLNGWRLADILACSSGAKNDIYGHLYLYLKHTLREFCRRLCTLKNLRINLFRMDAENLSTYLQAALGTKSYDRIDLSTLADPSYLTPRIALSLFAPLLVSKSKNPHATLLTVFPNVSPIYPEEDLDPGPDRVTNPNETRNDVVEISISKTITKKIHEKFLPITYDILLTSSICPGAHHADVVNFIAAHDLFLDKEGGFREFVQETDLENAGYGLGVRMKRKDEQTLLERWALGLDEDCTKAEFDMLFWSGHSGTECFVEWTRCWELDEGMQHISILD